MKRLLAPSTEGQIKDIALLLFRFVVGYLLISQHGFPKLQRLLSDEPVQFFSYLGMSPEVTMSLPMFAEFFCALLIIFGLFTRFAAIPLIINMAFIVFYVHGADSIGDRELPILFLISYVLIFFTGPGKYSIDHLLHQRFTSRKKVVAGY